MGCNCTKRKVKNNKDFDRNRKGAIGSKIRKIWKLSSNNGVVIKKISNS